jgi:phage shock protein A
MDEVSKLKEEIKELHQKYQDLEKEHISEIALLKSNLNNSVF